LRKKGRESLSFKALRLIFIEQMFHTQKEGSG